MSTTTKTRWSGAIAALSLSAGLGITGCAAQERVTPTMPPMPEATTTSTTATENATPTVAPTPSPDVPVATTTTAAPTPPTAPPTVYIPPNEREIKEFTLRWVHTLPNGKEQMWCEVLLISPTKISLTLTPGTNKTESGGRYLFHDVEVRKGTRVTCRVDLPSGESQSKTVVA